VINERKKFFFIFFKIGYFALHSLREREIDAEMCHAGCVCKLVHFAMLQIEMSAVRLKQGLFK
jgi:hypothetical protein